MMSKALVWVAAGSLLGAFMSGCGNDNGSTAGSATTTTSSQGTGGSGTGGNGGSASGGSGGAGVGGSGSGAGGQGGMGGSTSVWQPSLGTTWQWQLTDLPLDLSFDVVAYDVDLFETSDTEIAQLKADNRVLICYLSAGSWEPWRPDAGAFPESVKGEPLDAPFGEELWLDIRSAQVRSLIAARLDMAVQRGCDAVEPDNVDGYTNGNGLGLTAADQLDFNKWVAQEAHSRGLSVGLKNDVDQLDALEAHFDWALNEECYTYDECDVYSGNFIAAGKAVFHAEYVSANQLSNVCAVTKPLGLDTLIKKIDLDAYRLECP